MPKLPDGITQEDLDRYAQLDRGIKSLAEEHGALADRIKRAFKESGIEGNHTLVFPSERYGAVVVKTGQQMRLNQEALAALEEKFPQAEYPNNWISKINVPTLPVAEVDPFRVAVPTLSVSVAEAEPEVARRGTAV